MVKAGRRVAGRILVISMVVAAVGACTNPLATGVASNSGARSDSAMVDPQADDSLKSPNASIAANVVFQTRPTVADLASVSAFGTIVDTVDELNTVTVRTTALGLRGIQSVASVKAANSDRKRSVPPLDPVAVTDFSNGLSPWNLDAVNVTDFGAGVRQVAYDGSGVYIAVLDTGLGFRWQSYFPGDRIATAFARAFGGGGGERGTVSEQPNKWARDVDYHGTHVTSTILGYSLFGTPINGAAPKATIIPVKVLNNNGSGWSSVVARGITYVADLKGGPLSGHPVIITMSLGGPELDAMEQAAIDYAIAKGVIIVASAGNDGELGMGYPGAYAPVISVGASGWTGEWSGGSQWWYAANIPEYSNDRDYYIAEFSARQKAGQDLDVVAPGSWVVGPYQLNGGHTDYYFLGGTSMAAPHVAGIAALLAEKKPSITPSEVESILEATALPIHAGSRLVRSPSGELGEVSWGDDAAGAGLVQANRALSTLP